VKRIALFWVLPLLLLGCQGSPIQTQWEASENREALLGLNIGLTKADVLKRMGQPRKTEAYSVDKRNMEFWLYLTEGATVGDRRLKDSNFTPLVFEDGILIGWGRNFYDRTLKIEHKIEIK